MNTYPTVRGFTAIGTGGDDFVQAMVVAVESVIQQPIPQVCFIYQHHFSEAYQYFFRNLDLFIWGGVVDLCSNVLSATTSFYTREI